MIDTNTHPQDEIMTLVLHSMRHCISFSHLKTTTIKGHREASIIGLLSYRCAREPLGDTPPTIFLSHPEKRKEKLVRFQEQHLERLQVGSALRMRSIKPCEAINGSFLHPAGHGPGLFLIFSWEIVPV